MVYVIIYVCVYIFFRLLVLWENSDDGNVKVAGSEQGMEGMSVWMMRCRDTECRQLDFFLNEKLLKVASSILGRSDMIILSKTSF